MEDVADAIAAYLAADNTQIKAGSPKPSDVAWIVGDIGMGPPGLLPFAYVTPFNDQIDRARSTGGPHGIDMATLTIPLLIVFEPHDWTPPVQTDGTSPATYEQPGYRDFMRLAENVAHALRDNITLSGVVATSVIVERRFLLVKLDDKVYRALRMTLQLSQRRGR